MQAQALRDAPFLRETSQQWHSQMAAEEEPLMRGGEEPKDIAGATRDSGERREAEKCYIRS